MTKDLESTRPAGAGKQRARRVAILLWVLLATIYALTAKGTLGASDSLWSLRTAQAIVERGALSIDPSEKDAELATLTHGGKTYSKYGIGLPLLWIPQVAIADAVAAHAGLPAELTARFLVSFFNVFFGAAACMLMFYLLRFFGSSDKGAAAVALVLGLCTLAWRYSVWTFSEATQMFLLLGAVYGAVRNSPRSIAAGAICFGYLLLIKVFSIIYLPIFAVYIAARNRPLGRSTIGRLARFLAPSAVACAVLLVLNYVRFGNPLEAGYGAETLRFHPASLPLHAFQLLLSLDMGLFVYCPILALAVLGYVRFARAAKREALFFISLIAANLCTVAMWHDCTCSWNWGPRFLVPVVPLCLLPLAWISFKGTLAKLGVIAVVVVSLAIQMVGVIQNGFEYVHIRENMVSSQTRRAMPAIPVGTAIILKHKILKGTNVYALSEFGVDSGETVDTSDQENMIGYNLWYFYLARYYGKPAIRMVPLLFLPAIILLTIGLVRALDLRRSVAPARIRNADVAGPPFW